MNAAATDVPALEQPLRLKTYNAETLSAQELRQFLARPRIDFTSILQKVLEARLAYPCQPFHHKAYFNGLPASGRAHRGCCKGPWR